ncbi:iron complex outermembrane receptor protein [Novosphingobium kunmingense]|uniref:Iron complex outermembrane receptor protein n=1 Tax=Novosphingobium kunmingense TaxID=1211806 RepID=A0A2N0I122_9SPHN|nr:TonB-dependent receptor [Novosphingobium kunmingense]PKB24882.1 iron complex outermembrane receptor protein [Novosphingobium kunmingense]
MIRFSYRTHASLAALGAALALGNAGVAAASNLTVTATGVTVDGAAPADEAAEPASAEAAPAEAGAPPQSDAGLTEIVVTATKRETNLQRTPISISVMGADELKKRNVQSLMDLADGSVPSLRISTFEARQSALTIGIRGIVPDDANQPAREQGVGVYLDGVYLGRQHGLNASLFDVQRIEVLKGPQGTLFGRNTEGGAVSMVLRQPTGEFGGRASAGVGNYGSYNGQIHLDLPAIANVSFKLDGVIQHQDPTTRNTMPGQAGFNQYHRVGGRIAARWKPVDGLSVDLAYDKSRDENTPFYSQLVTITPAALASLPKDASGKPLITWGYGRMEETDIQVPQQVSVGKAQGFTSTIRWNASDDLELRSITAWRTVSDDQWDNSGGAHRTPVWGPNVNFSRYSLATLDQRQFSQELQAVGSIGDAVEYVAGLYYFNERANDTARTPNTNRWNSTVTGYTINDPLTYQTATLARASIAFAKSYAAYGQVTVAPIEPLRLTVGGRYTRDEKDGRLYIVNGAATNFTFDQVNNRFDPLAVIAWQATPEINLYAKYATGYRAGGASSRSLTYLSFGPEQVKSYELGFKSELFNRKVRFNIAGYMMDRTDTQVDFNFFLPQPNGTVRNTLETVNAMGTTKIRGIEADLTVRPVDGLSMNLSYAYTYSKIPPARNTVQEALNATLTPPVTTPVYQTVYILYTPKNALSGSVDYDLPVSDNGTLLRFHLDANYSDPVHTFANEPTLSDKSFIVNGRLSLSDIPMGTGDQRLTLALWARNLFNEEHIYRRSAANTALGDYANYNAPRTFGVEATLAF